MKPLRLGLLGGTFDPPHLGHLWLAETGRSQLALDRVLFLPTGQPPHKQAQRVTPAFHRVAMLRLALAAAPDPLAALFAVDTTDVDRPPPHTTVTLLPRLQQAHPSARFWLLVGSDSLAELATWAAPSQLLRLCRLAVLPRPGVIIDWVQLTAAVPAVETAVEWLRGPRLGLSSTDIRAWARTGGSLTYLVPPRVAGYIEAHGLYPTA